LAEGPANIAIPAIAHSGGIEAFRRNRGIPAESRHSGGIEAFRRNRGIPAESRHSGIDTGMFRGMHRNRMQPESSFQNGILFIIELTF
jgi:hypothetical protein